MGLDIRLPIGLLFTLVGAVLVGYGVLSEATLYQRSLGFNVNLWWGLVLLAFGLIFLYYGRRGTSAMRPAEASPEGQAMEAREHGTVER
jgi:hypothetical protein